MPTVANYVTFGLYNQVAVIAAYVNFWPFYRGKLAYFSCALKIQCSGHCCIDACPTVECSGHTMSLSMADGWLLQPPVYRWT